MEVNCVQNIEENFSVLVERTHAVDYLLMLLKNKEVISENDFKRIQAKKSERERAAALYEMALRFGKKGISTLYDAVWSTGQRDIAAIIKPKVFQKGQSFVELNCINGAHGEYIPLERFDITVIKSQRKVPSDHNEVYKMSSKPKGLVFILDNRFPLEGELPTMLKEREHVKSLFLGLDFEVISYENLTANELTEKVTNFAQLEKHSKLDCCAVFVMADGFDDRESYKGILMSTSDRKLISTEWIVSQFTDIKCPHLKKKPKLFFFQSTRSLYLEDYTRVIMEAKEPVSKDTIIVSASYADITNGNGFAHIICDVFMKKAYNTDIRTMLHDVSKMMKKIYYEYTGPVQLRIMTVGFDKKLYFNPGLFDK